MRFRGRIAAAIALLSLAGLASAEQGPLPSPAAADRPSISVAPAHPLVREDLAAWLDGYMATKLERNDVAGAVVVVVKDGAVFYQKGYGYADVAARRPFDPDTTLFRPGSVSKLMTWTAVMQQVELGKIDLDRDLNGYLDFKIPPFQGRPVTMRNLMTHTPGFQEELKDMLQFDPNGRSMSLGSFLKDQLPPRVYPPGEVPSYSNYGAALAGYVVERVSGQSFEDYADQHIFRPLGMSKTTFREPLPAYLRPGLSRGYRRGSGPPVPYEMFPAPAGSAASTGSDMAKFMIAHLQNGQLGGASIMKPETARLMHDTALTTISPALNRMMLGFWGMNRNGHRVIGHEGDTLFFHSVLKLLPDDNVGIFVLVNSVGQNEGGRAIRDELGNAFLDRYFAGPPLPSRRASATAREHAERIAGTYSPSQRWQVGYASLLDLGVQTIVTTDGSGHISASSITGLNGEPLQFEEIAPFIWRELNGRMLLAAKVVDGKVAMWSNDEKAPTGVFVPTPATRNATWLVPLLLFSITVLLLTMVQWPIVAWVHRRYAAPPRYEGFAAQTRRWALIGSAASLALILLWFSTLAWIVSSFSFTSTLDPWIHVLQVLSLIIFPAAALANVWNAWIASTQLNRRHFLRWVGAVLNALGCASLLYVSVTFGLIGFSLAL